MRLLLLLLIGLPFSVHAAELFGVKLNNADQAELRAAAKNAGANLIKEAGKFTFFDEYNSQGVLDGSDRLYLGFSKQTKEFVFAEYEFHGINRKTMLLKLKMKYGQPKIMKGKYISDKANIWMVDGVEVRYQIDWPNYKTRVSYTKTDLLPKLLAEKKKIDAAILRGKLNKQASAY
ncbi:MAG: hypothetical protein ISR69_03230 [Gammaproteobacteria bacterium]|nr:hypothetical protein [Gammaproteobacteria bacterium]